MGYFLYRFLSSDEVIYIGKTKNLERRISKHFSGNGHLEHDCIYETDKVEYAKVETNTEMDMLEIYYINKFAPKYNKINNYQEKNIFISINEVKWCQLEEFEIFKAKYELMKIDLKKVNEAKVELQALKNEINFISYKLEKIYENINNIERNSVVPLIGYETREKDKINNKVSEVLSIIKRNIYNKTSPAHIIENVHYKIIDERYLINFKSIWPILETYFKDEYDELMSRKDFIKMLIKSKYICGETSKHYYKTIRLSGEACKVYVCNLKDL